MDYVVDFQVGYNMASDDPSKQFGYVGGKRYWAIVSRYSLGLLFMDRYNRLFFKDIRNFSTVQGFTPEDM